MSESHYSDCELNNGPATLPRLCSCGVSPGFDPLAHNSEFPSQEEATAYRQGFNDAKVQARILKGKE